MDLEQRFWNKVNKGKPNECWEWQAYITPTGYGRIRLKTNNKWRYVYAHRVSWILHNEEIPEGKGYHGTCVLHKCDNKKCVNPNHLFLGTQKDNIRDRDKKGRAQRGENHIISRFTEESVNIIRELYKRPDLSQADLAREFNVDQSTVWSVVNRKTWKHI